MDTEKPTTILKTSLEDLSALEDFISSRVEERVSKHLQDDYESTDTDKLCAALGKAQGLFPKISANRAGYHMNSNYADLDVMAHAVRPALEANGLSVTHQVDSTDNGTIVTSKLRHATGQFIGSRIRVLGAKGDIEFNESIKNMKRKAFESLLNITHELDPEDNDSQEEAARDELAMVKGGYKAPKKRYKTISKDLQRELQKELDFFPDLSEALFAELKIRSLKDIEDKDYDDVITKVRRRKEARSTGNYEGI
jgi:hypothetical protein